MQKVTPIHPRLYIAGKFPMHSFCPLRGDECPSTLDTSSSRRRQLSLSHCVGKGRLYIHMRGCGKCIVIPAGSKEKILLLYTTLMRLTGALIFRNPGQSCCRIEVGPQVKLVPFRPQGEIGAARSGEEGRPSCLKL